MTNVTGILEQRLIGAKCIYNIYDIHIYYIFVADIFFQR